MAYSVDFRRKVWAARLSRGRCFGQHDWNAPAALLNKELLIAAPADGSIDVGLLPPELPDKSVAVTDNAAFHKRDGIQEAASLCGHELELPPPCSPDFNPIEHKRAQAEAPGRKYRCSAEELFQGNML